MLKAFYGKNSLDSIFYPNSIAIVGASSDKDKIGGYICSELLKISKWKVFPVNFKWKTIQGKKAYTNVGEIGRVPDLAVIAIPREPAIKAIEQCAQVGIKNVIVITAGFKETGEEGKKLEEYIKKIIVENNMNLIGPNCLGILNPEIGLNCSFAKDIPKSGDVALISQSGAVIDGIIDWSFKHNIGFSKIVSLGNMAGIDELSILKYLKEDKKTSAIVFYMETLEKGKEFAKVLNEISKVKPVIIIKPGKSKNAKVAIGSHTGSLAQDSILVETLIKENNGILVSSLNELFNVLVGLKSKKSEGKKTVIVTNAGGPGVISTDAIDRSEFELLKMTDERKKAFSFLPKEASLNNPIDLLGDAKSDRYGQTLELLVQDSKIDNIFVLLTPQIMTDSLEIAKKLVEIAKKSKKCVFSCFVGDKEIKQAIEFFDENNFSNFQTPNEAIVAMNYLHKYRNFNYERIHNNYPFDKEKISNLNEIIKKKEGLLDLSLTRKILDCLAIYLPSKQLLNAKTQIENVHLKENKRYVLKANSKKLIHKKEFKAVELGIDCKNYKDKISDMFDNLKNLDDLTLSLEEEFKGTEVIVGLKSDETLGNFIMFGLGGTYVSIFKDIHFKACPLTKNCAEELVKRSKAYELLKGFRDLKPVHLDLLYETLVRMSYLQKLFPSIKEVDLNPIICNDKGIYLVDVKLLV